MRGERESMKLSEWFEGLKRPTMWGGGGDWCTLLMLMLFRGLTRLGGVLLVVVVVGVLSEPIANGVLWMALNA